MNSITLIGRLTADPESRSTQGGTAVTTIRLAVQRPKGRDSGERGAVFVDVTCFAGLAEVCGKHLEKGRRVAVSGRLEHDQWQAGDGTRRQRHYVVADEVEFLDQKPVGVEAVTESDDEPAAKPARSRRAKAA